MNQKVIQKGYKQVEQVLEESEQQFYDLFENANDLMQSVGPDGRFIHVNRAWRETLGYTQEEIPNLSLFDVIHADSRAHCMEMFQKVMSGETIDRVEAAFRTKHGKNIIVEGSVNCRFVNGKPVATRGIFRNITEHKKLERDLEERVIVGEGEIVKVAEQLALKVQAVVFSAVLGSLLFLAGVHQAVVCFQVVHHRIGGYVRHGVSRVYGGCTLIDRPCQGINSYRELQDTRRQSVPAWRASPGRSCAARRHRTDQRFG